MSQLFKSWNVVMQVKWQCSLCIFDCWYSFWNSQCSVGRVNRITPKCHWVWATHRSDCLPSVGFAEDCSFWSSVLCCRLNSHLKDLKMWSNGSTFKSAWPQPFKKPTKMMRPRCCCRICWRHGWNRKLEWMSCAYWQIYRCDVKNMVRHLTD